MSLAESLSFRRCAALGSSLDSSRLLLPEKMNSDQGGNVGNVWEVKVPTRG